VLNLLLEKFFTFLKLSKPVYTTFNQSSHISRRVCAQSPYQRFYLYKYIKTILKTLINKLQIRRMWKALMANLAA